MYVQRHWGTNFVLEFLRRVKEFFLQKMIFLQFLYCILEILSLAQKRVPFLQYMYHTMAANVFPKLI